MKKTPERKTNRFHMVMEPSLREQLEDMAYHDRVDAAELIRRLLRKEAEKRAA